VTDLVEPAQIVASKGTGVLGPMSGFDSSDDQRVTITQDRTGANPFDFRARFQLNEASPTAVTLSVEDRANDGGFLQDLYVRNVTTGQWDLVDSALLGTADATRTVALSTPASYVDPTAMTVEVRMVVTSQGPAGSPGGPGRRAQLEVDLLRLDVTYP
jgi:hypothetical protein